METEINIKESGLSQGNIIRLKVKDLGEGKIYEWVIKVENFGINMDISFPLVMVLPSGEKKFRGPWPGITYALRYKPREYPFIDFLGAGLNFVLLDFDSDKNIELGMGAVITIWENRLQMGFGHDLTGGGNYVFLCLNIPQFFPFVMHH